MVGWRQPYAANLIMNSKDLTTMRTFLVEQSHEDINVSFDTEASIVMCHVVFLG